MGTSPVRPHRRRYGDARMVVGEVRGRVGRDEAGGSERVGGGRPMGQAIAMIDGLSFWVGGLEGNPWAGCVNAVTAAMEGYRRIVWYYRFGFFVLYLGFIWRIQIATAANSSSLISTYSITSDTPEHAISAPPTGHGSTARHNACSLH